MKQKESWICSDCSNSALKWSGSCFVCKSWNTMERFTETGEKHQKYLHVKSAAVQINDVKSSECERVITNICEIDRLVGGGFVEGSIALVAGDPGIGKSTLMMMLGDSFCKIGKCVLYVCAEESVEQMSMRAKRIGVSGDNLYLLSETLFENIQEQIDKLKPDVLIIDSIQIVYKGDVSSLPGSVSQVKEIAMECMRIAKHQGIITFLVGHVTKTGDIAGPRILEHIVDTVLDFEGDPDHGYRILRANKNRFGSTDEVAMFLMKQNGLEEVPNPSEIFLQERAKGVTGSAIMPTIEGSRCILVEVQALVAASAFPTCARRCSGIDQNRLSLLLAVLEKRTDYHFNNFDVFVSIAGGMRIREPAVDLAVIVAIASSLCNKSIDSSIVVFGEVGLGGEIRSVPRVENRIREAIHMGFTKCILPKRNLLEKKQKIEMVGIDKIDEVIDYLFR